VILISDYCTVEIFVQKIGDIIHFMWFCTMLLDRYFFIFSPIP